MRPGRPHRSGQPGVKEIQLGIKNGVRKIKVGTDSRLAMTGAIRKVFAEHPEEFDPRIYLKPGARSDESSDRTTDDRIRQHASDYQPIPLAEMAKRYAGETV